MKSFPDKILVTGLGAVTPLGATMADNWRAVLGKRSAVAPITRFDLGGIACQRGGIIDGADASAGGLATSFALSAVREAILQSGANAAHLGLITGSNFGEADHIPCDHGEIARRVASSLGLGGPIASLSLSCASGASVIAIAADWIACGAPWRATPSCSPSTRRAAERSAQRGPQPSFSSARTSQMRETQMPLRSFAAGPPATTDSI